MKAENVTFQLQAQLYADLQSVAADEQTDPVEVIARLVATARQRRAWVQGLTALWEQIRRMVCCWWTLPKTRW